MKKKKWLVWAYAILAALFLAVAIFCVWAAIRLNNAGYGESWRDSDGEIVEKIGYGDEDWQNFDLYLPANLDKTRPQIAIVFVHGGAWIVGSSWEESAFCKRFAKKGFVCASINYRLYREEEKDEYSFAAILDEIDAALAKIKIDAAERGITVDRVALSGNSAGAHLATLYSYTRAKTAPLPILFVAPRVGPSDFHVETWGPSFSSENAASFVVWGSGGKISAQEVLDKTPNAEKIVAEISPAAQVRADSVPTLAAYGGKDWLVPPGHRERLVEALDAVGARYDLVLFPNSWHILGNDPEKTQEYFRLFDEYLEKYATPEPIPESEPEPADESEPTDESEPADESESADESEPTDESESADESESLPETTMIKSDAPSTDEE